MDVQGINNNSLSASLYALCCKTALSINLYYILLGQEGAGSNQAHDLVGALEDTVDTRITEVDVDLVILQVSVASVQLQAVVANLEALVRSMELGHRTEAGNAGVVLVQHGRSLTDHQSGREQAGGHVCKLELSVLEVGEGLVELLTDLDVLQSCLQRSLSSTQTA